MASKVTDSQTGNAVGAVNPATLTSFPALGGSFHLKLSAGTATVRVRLWNINGTPETAYTFVFPVPATDNNGMPNPNVGAMSDMGNVYGRAEDFDYYIDAITGGGTVTMEFRGTEV